MVANSLIVRKSETRFFVQKKGAMVLDLLCSVIGFMWVICLVGALRELLGNGTLWNMPVLEDSTIPGLLLPFSGFIVIGFIAAGFQKFRNHFMEQKERTDFNRRCIVSCRTYGIPFYLFCQRWQFAR